MANKPSFPSKSEELTDSERSVGAGIGGVILGASLGGPFGAVIGGLSGLILADVVNEDKKKEDKIVRKRAFISFDYDHDLDLKTMLIGQAKHPDTPFDIADFSIKEAIAKDWKDKARTKIKGCDVVIVICGQNTSSAGGVAAEVEIAQEENIPYFLLWGRSDKTCVKPTTANASDKIYKWTWNNLKALINGSR